MKRTVSLILVILAAVSVLPFGVVNAEQRTASEDKIILLDDGGYIEIIEDQVSTIASTTITKNKTFIRYNDSDEALWAAKLTATFTYNGTSSVCTASSCTVTVYSSNWHTISKSATKSGNTAAATVTMGRTLGGITIDQETYRITLTCDKNGNVS